MQKVIVKIIKGVVYYIITKVTPPEKTFQDEQRAEMYKGENT